MAASIAQGYLMNLKEMTQELVRLSGSQMEATRESGVPQGVLSKILARPEYGATLKTADKIKAALSRIKRRKKDAATCTN